RAGTAGTAARATPSSIASATSRSRTLRVAAGTSSPAASRSRAPRPACSAPTDPQGSLRRKAGRPSSSSPLLLDPDRRAERRESLEVPRSQVRDTHATVRDGLAEQLGKARAVDADD